MIVHLTVSLVKTEFCHAVVEYLGHAVCNSHVKFVLETVDAIVIISVPQ